VTLLLFGLVYAFALQVVYQRDFEFEARMQHLDSIIPLPGRGRIVDAQGRPVALTRSSFKVTVYPTLLADEATRREGRCSTRTRAARKVACVCGRDFSAVLSEMKRHEAMYVFDRNLDYDTGTRLKDSLRKGGLDNAVVVEPQKDRMYPYGDTLASVLGFAQVNLGKTGLEEVLDPVLCGIPGKIIVQKDALGNRHRFPDYPDMQPESGADVYLTIDVDFQRVAFEELKTCVDSFGADAGSVIVLDCRTGEVKAMCDYPYRDPRWAAKPESASYSCRAAEMSFEPGSVFKTVLGLAALESPRRDQIRAMSFDVSSGVLELGGYKIHDVHPCGVQDFPGIFILSSNVGLSKLSMVVERPRYYRTMSRLGFGKLTGIELPGEDSGYLDVGYRVAPDKMSPLRVANNAFGQGLKTTLLQLLDCYAAIANDGLLMRPYLIKQIRQGDQVLYEGEPLKVRQAVSVSAAREMKEILARVVTEGTGKSVRSPYFSICGKTGTAEKALPGRGYKDGQIIATFAGFFPKEKPEYAVALCVDNPRFGRFAGTIVGPTYRRLCERCYGLSVAPITQATFGNH
jgi:cell division protein FtsI/penicillin-binding protein 2